MGSSLISFLIFLVLVSISAFQVPAPQRQALVDLYTATNGPSWTRNTNWNVSDPCTNNWQGVYCYPTGTVIRLYLDLNNLSGTIPLSISNLTNLQLFYFDYNSLSGTIPLSISNLTNLQLLILSSNHLSGTVLPSIGNLTNLQQLLLAGNGLTGSIPSSIGNLINLQQLALNDNGLSGSIPSSIGNLIHLTSLNLGHNGLEGSIPSSIGNLVSLSDLFLDHNNLSGTIPSSIGNLTNLQQLYLYNNNLSGTIPSSIGNLTNLQQLKLGFGNSLSGTIPSSLGDLTNLNFLDLSGNDLSGTIPSSIGNLTNVQQLYLNYNSLSGTIPSSIGDLTNLQTLFLNNNQLIGTLPNFLQIQPPPPLLNINLDNNDFSCPAPTWCSATICTGCIAGPQSSTSLETPSSSPSPLVNPSITAKLSESAASTIRLILLTSSVSPVLTKTATPSSSVSAVERFFPNGIIQTPQVSHTTLPESGGSVSCSLLSSESSACLFNHISSISGNTYVAIVGNSSSSIGTVTIPPNTLGSSGLLSISTNESHPSITSQVISPVIDVSFFTAQNANSFHNLSGSIQICIQPNTGTKAKTSCLGYLDTNVNPPQWVCQDPCVTFNNNGDLCGTTNHLTNFAIVFYGGQSACSSDFIFGSYGKDLALVGSIAAFIILLCFFILVLSFHPHSQKLVYGKEGLRVRANQPLKIDGPKLKHSVPF